MKETLKCQKCGFEWNSRVSNPERCPECNTRSWRRIDSGGESVPSGGDKDSVTSGDKAVTTLAVTTPKAKAVPGWKDSVAAPGMYKVCEKHGMRYCRKCKVVSPAENLDEPGAITKR